MLRIEDTVKKDLCIGCGFCIASSPIGMIKIVLDDDHDRFIPVVQGSMSPEEDSRIVCPGARLDMVELSMQVHRRLPTDYRIGVYQKIRVCYDTDPSERGKASSGGVAPAVLRNLFEKGAIDIAYCLAPGTGPYDAKGRILRSPKELEYVHGSVYHPTNFGAELQDLVYKETGRFAYVGLPCQIAGLEIMKSRIPSLKSRHALSIGLFCGGLNRFAGISYYLRGFGIDWKEIAAIEYRKGPWPGKINIQRNSNRGNILVPRIAGNSRWKILRYLASFQGYWMIKRCRLCADPLSDFADISVGDPHLPIYRRQSDKGGFSLVVTRTQRGESQIRELIHAGRLHEDQANTETVYSSQGYTLDNRRHVHSYMCMAKIFKETVPELKIYPTAIDNVSLRHYKWAIFDLLKLKLRRYEMLRPFYPFFQALEYLFITFYPSLFFERLSKILRNKSQV